MKKIVLLLLGLVAFSGFAQQKTQAEQTTELMKEVLELTPAQVARVKVINEEQFKKYPQYKAVSNKVLPKTDDAQQTAVEKEAKAKQVIKENAEFDSKLKQVLTSEQLAKWQYTRENPLAAGLKAGAKGKKG